MSELPKSRAETALAEILSLLPLLSETEYGRLRHYVATRPYWMNRVIDPSEVGTNIVHGGDDLTEHKGESAKRKGKGKSR